MSKKYAFETLQLHVGQEQADPATDSRAVPIYQTTSYVFHNSDHAQARFGLADAGNIYGRLTNSTQDVFEKRIAALEGGVAGLATASGAAALAYTFQALAKAGDHIVSAKTIYGGTYNYLEHTFPEHGVKTTFVDPDDLQNFEDAIQDNTKLIFFETLGNPNSNLVDIEALAKIAHKHGIPLVADSTFATPYLLRPIEYGVDIVVHSATKYLNGHGDVIAGFVVGSAEFCNEVRMFGLKDMTGAVMDPFCAFLILRGLKTLEIRMQKHCANAKAVAEFLYDHPAVEKVYYPGLIDHPGHDIARRQMRDFGGMLSFEVKGGRAAGVKLVNALHLVTVAVSLGDAETLIEHPASMTHSTYTEEELAASGIAAGLIRLSVGLENAEDLIADLKQALDTL